MTFEWRGVLKNFPICREAIRDTGGFRTIVLKLFFVLRNFNLQLKFFLLKRKNQLILLSSKNLYDEAKTQTHTSRGFESSVEKIQEIENDCRCNEKRCIVVENLLILQSLRKKENSKSLKFATSFCLPIDAPYESSTPPFLYKNTHSCVFRIFHVRSDIPTPGSEVLKSLSEEWDK